MYISLVTPPTWPYIGATIALEVIGVPEVEGYFATLCVTLQDVEEGLMRSVIVNVTTISGTAGKSYSQDFFPAG